MSPCCLIGRSFATGGCTLSVYVARGVVVATNGNVCNFVTLPGALRIVWAIARGVKDSRGHFPGALRIV